jgi:predicted Zn-dependent protease
VSSDRSQRTTRPADEVDAFARGEVTLAALRGYSEDELASMAELGYALFRQGRHDLARIVFRGLASLTGREYPLRALGAIALAARQPAEAVTLLGEAITRHPAGLPSRVLRAEALAGMGRYAEAVADLEWVMRAAPRDAEEQALRRRAAAIRRRLARPGAM